VALLLQPAGTVCRRVDDELRQRGCPLSGGELHLGGDRRRAVLVDPAGEVRPDPVAQHSRGAMMRREASSFSSSSAIVENVSFDAFLQEESSSGEG